MEADVTAQEIEAGATGFKRRRWYHRRDFRFVALIAVLMAAFYTYGYVTGPAKISAPLASAIESGEARLKIQVFSYFPPEAFHLSIYQNLGSMRGSEGNASTLYGVKPEDIHMLSRKYWVEKIVQAPEQ